MSTVTKRDLVNEIAEHTGFTQVEVKETIEHLLTGITEILSDNSAIEIRGFGTFYPKVRKPRPARNIRTGEVVPLKKRVVPLFRYATSVKTKVNNALKGGDIEPLFDTI